MSKNALIEISENKTFDNLEIINLKNKSKRINLAITLRCFFVCRYIEGLGLTIQESIANKLQGLSDTYCLPVLANDKFFTPKNTIDYLFFDTKKLEKKKESIKKTRKKTIKDIDYEILKKNRAKEVYFEISSGVSCIEGLMENLKLSESVVKNYLLKLEYQGFVKKENEFYSFWPERDYVLRLLISNDFYRK
jgi:ribosomal protein S6